MSRDGAWPAGRTANRSLMPLCTHGKHLWRRAGTSVRVADSMCAWQTPWEEGVPENYWKSRPLWRAATDLPAGGRRETLTWPNAGPVRTRAGPAFVGDHRAVLTYRSSAPVFARAISFWN